MSDIDTPAPYQVGETVDITIRGAKVASFDQRGLWLDLGVDDPGSRLPVIGGKLPAGVDVTLVEPIDGAPQVGDLWADHLGTSYVAYLQRRNHGPDEVLLHNGQSSYRMAELCGGRFRMKLIYRAPVPPCSTCSGTGWVHQEGQVGVPGSGCTHGCPDCPTGIERLAKGELREVSA